MYGIYESGKVIAKFVAPVTVKSNVPVFASDTLSLKRRVSRRTAQRWEIETRIEPLSFTAEDLFANLVTKGHSEAISIVMPQNYGVIKKRTSTSTPTATGAAGSSVISITGNTGFIPRGNFIKFNGITKIYMLTDAINGNGSVGIFPQLRTNVNAVFAHRDDVIMPCYYDLDTIIGMTYSDGILMDIGTVKLVEAL
jgi:hypothetical protein